VYLCYYEIAWLSLIDFISPNSIESDKLASLDHVPDRKVHSEDTESMETEGVKTADEFPSLTTAIRTTPRKLM
jgi:hypothetical protein